jgi:hypothetical protein
VTVDHWQPMEHLRPCEVAGACVGVVWINQIEEPAAGKPDQIPLEPRLGKLCEDPLAALASPPGRIYEKHLRRQYYPWQYKANPAALGSLCSWEPLDSNHKRGDVMEFANVHPYYLRTSTTLEGKGYSNLAEARLALDNLVNAQSADATSVTEEPDGKWVIRKGTTVPLND